MINNLVYNVGILSTFGTSIFCITILLITFIDSEKRKIKEELCK